MKNNTSDAGDQVRDLVTVARVTTRVRNVPTEVPLGPDSGLPQFCVVNVDILSTIRQKDLSARIAVLPPAKQKALDDALRFALGLGNVT